jgi:hypothetical protein
MLNSCYESLLMKLLKMVVDMWFMATFNYNVYPIRRRKRSCALFTAKGNVTMAEWSAHAPIVRVVVSSLRKTVLKNYLYTILLGYLLLLTCKQ